MESRYDFSWYLRGPYCPSLTANGFALKSIYDRIPNEIKARCEQSRKQAMFERFKEMVAGKSVDQMEIMASLHYQSTVQDDAERIKETVQKKRDGFTAQDVGRMWDEPGRYGLV